MRVLPGILACICGCFLASCAGFLPPLISFAHFSHPIKGAGDVPPNQGVVYGRFTSGPDFAFGNELALWISEKNNKQQYLIRCREKDPVYGVAVVPGKYSVTGFVGTGFDHRTMGVRRFKEHPWFEVPSNAAVYLGDFLGYAKINVVSQEWGFETVTNNFASTTDEFRHKFPSFTNIVTISAFSQLTN